MAVIVSGHGGARTGAGRKPKRDKHSGAINRAEKKIVDSLPEIVEAQIKLALGILVQSEPDENGVVEVFNKAPDVKAGQYLIDRILGKPTQKQEISGEEGGPLVIKVEYADPEDAGTA